MFYMRVNSASATLTSVVVVPLRKLNVRVFVVMSVTHKRPLCLDTDSLASAAPGRLASDFFRPAWDESIHEVFTHTLINPTRDK